LGTKYHAQSKSYIYCTLKSFEGTARTVDKLTEHKLAGEIANLMNAKYGWSDGLIVELTPRNEQIK
jgi:hypothetical protein